MYSAEPTSTSDPLSEQTIVTVYERRDFKSQWYSYHLMRAIVLAHLKKQASALSEANTLAAIAEAHPGTKGVDFWAYGEYFYRLACVFAVVASSEKAGSKAAEEHRSRAVELLKKAIVNG